MSTRKFRSAVRLPERDVPAGGPHEGIDDLGGADRRQAPRASSCVDRFSQSSQHHGAAAEAVACRRAQGSAPSLGVDDAEKAEKLIRNLARRLEHDAPGGDFFFRLQPHLTYFLRLKRNDGAAKSVPVDFPSIHHFWRLLVD